MSDGPSVVSERCNYCRERFEHHATVIVDYEKRVICPKIRRAFGER